MGHSESELPMPIDGARSRRSVLRRGATASAAVTALALIPRPAAAFLERWLAPSKDLWERWAVHDPSSSRDVDHAAWTLLLQRHLRTDAQGVNRFAYGSVIASDRRLLDQYIGQLAQTMVSRLNRPAQFAYWVNLYNALTVQVILAHYPVISIRDIDISPGVFSDGPWGRKLVRIEGELMSLDDIEHRILRPLWNDPRIHYAVNCAAIGCPNLQPQAFTVANTEPMLEQAARTYVNSARGVWFQGDALYASSIYNWFREDFGDSEAGVVRHLGQYAEPALGQRLLGRRSIEGFAYDWSLNDAA